MARITFPGAEEFGAKLRQLEEAFSSDEPLKRAVAKGAEPVADAIRSALGGVSSEPFRLRKLRAGEKLSGLSNSEKKDLQASFGLAPVQKDSKGVITTKAGFDGYGSHPTKSYPGGVPNQLVARAVESGSSVRQKAPFVRPAVSATRNKAIQEMEKSIDEDLKKIF